MGLAFDQPASLLDYLPENTLIAVDEPEQCQAHADRWLETVEDHWAETQAALARVTILSCRQLDCPKFIVRLPPRSKKSACFSGWNSQKLPKRAWPQSGKPTDSDDSSSVWQAG